MTTSSTTAAATDDTTPHDSTVTMPPSSTTPTTPTTTTLLPCGPVMAYSTRFKPGDDVVSCLLEFARNAMEQSNNAQSAFMLSVVGSLECVTLRMANTGKRLKTMTTSSNNGGDDDTTTTTEPKSSRNEIRTWNERLEIVSLVGTFDKDGGFHLHMSVSDSNGHVWGGHLINGTIFTTLELVLGVIPGVQYTRPMDDGPNGTGFNELVVKSSSSPSSS